MSVDYSHFREWVVDKNNNKGTMIWGVGICAAGVTQKTYDNSFRRFDRSNRQWSCTGICGGGTFGRMQIHPKHKLGGGKRYGSDKRRIVLENLFVFYHFLRWVDDRSTTRTLKLTRE